MAKKQFDEKLAAIESAGKSGDPAAAETVLRKALGDRNNFVVSKAAKAAGDCGMTSLTGALTAAFERFMEGAAKSDPQCWAKNTIVQALADLGHTDPAIYLKGLKHVQLEPVWNGQVDTAAMLRSRCAHALVDCRVLEDEEILLHLVELLADSEKTVRAEAARAIGRFTHFASGLLLRLRALVGDEEPEVIGACLTSLLAAEGTAAVAFAARFMERRGDVAAEAALAIGSLPGERSFEALRGRMERRCDPELAQAIFMSIALLRWEPGYEYLLRLIRTGSSRAGTAATAMARAGVPAPVQAQLERAVKESGDTQLEELVRRS